MQSAKRSGTLVAALILAVVSVASLQAQPSNDSFANRQPLTNAVETLAGSNVGATTESGEPFRVGGARYGATLWWRWTAPLSAPVRIDTIGSTFNTVLGAYTGTLGALNEIASNDDAPGTSGGVSRIAFNAQQGAEYVILLAGYRATAGSTPATGNFEMHLQMSAAVTLTSPVNGSVYAVGSPITLVATAVTPNPPIARVDFFNGPALIASVADAPYSCVLSNAPLGTNRLAAIATDAASQTATSAVVNVTVLPVGLTLTAPADGATYLNTNPITVSAVAALPAGAMTRVEFLVNGAPFGSGDASPFSAAWSGVVPGAHQLTAVGADDAGNAYTSAPVMIAVARPLTPAGSVWKYLENGSDQGTAWVAPEFDDTAWSSGPAPLGYGDANGQLPATTNSFGPNPANKYTTTYYRQTFTASDAANYTNLVLRVQRDDGVVLYLNGTEVYRQNMPAGTITYTTFALSAVGTTDEVAWYSTNVPPSLLREGPNSLAAEIHQSDLTSSDIWFNLELLGVPIIPRNQPPLVTLLSPTNGEVLLAPVALTLTAEASDADGSVSQVEFFVDGLRLGTTNASPYQVLWDQPGLGWHAVYAVATDDQGAQRSSTTANITVLDIAGTPLVALTNPAEGAVFVGPTNLTLSARASGLGGITNVVFYANDTELGATTSSPHELLWSDVPFGSNRLFAVAYDAQGASGTSAVVSILVNTPAVNTNPPVVFRATPAPGAGVSNLTSIQVTFSENVLGVDASDLLVNGVPGTGLSGSGSNYTFTVTPPPVGPVTVTWTADAGITDNGWPSALPFDGHGPGATWTYEMLDVIAPAIIARDPVAGATLTNLTQITVTFSEPVNGVDAADLLVNGTPATSLAGADPSYTFGFALPGPGAVNIAWAIAHGITDRASPPNAFHRTGPGATWSYTLDSRIVLVESNATWRFLKGFAEASTPMNAWRFPGFDDSGWSNSPAPFFYGDTGYTNALISGTPVTDMFGGAYSSIYFRKEFVVTRPTALTNLYLVAQSDDGFIAWINGVEVVRYNMAAGDVPYNGSAPVPITEPNNNGAPYVTHTLTNANLYLVEGTNQLAIHAFNNQPLTSSDFGFNAQLYTYPPPPLTPEPRVTLTAPANGALYLAPVDILLSAAAVDEDGQVGRVEFFDGGIKVGEVTRSPYSFTWSNVPPGDHALTAVATDDAGLSSTSAPVQITVERAGTSLGLLFDGVNDYVTFSNAPALGLGVFTLEAWFYWNGTGVAASSGNGGVMAYPLMAKGRGEADGNNRDANYFFGIQPGTNVLVADFEEGAGGASPGLNHPVFGVTPVTSNVWHHAALTFDGSNWQIILDGNLETNQFVGQPPRSDSLQHASLASALDSTGQPQGFFAGVLDEVRVWNLALDASRVASNRFSRIDSAPGLVAHWGLDEVSGDIAFDSTTNAVHGLVRNGPLRVKGYPFAQAPTVALQQPTNNAVFFAPASVMIEVEVQDADGVVTNVEFLADGLALGQRASTPFALDWAGVPPGRYDLTAVATDDSGRTGTSAVVRIVVENPVIQITSPAHLSRWAEPATIEIAAQVSEPQASSALVEFYVNSILFSTVTPAPFQVAWTNVPAGAYELVAVAMEGGIRHTSAPVWILVVSNQPPAVVLTAPAPGAVFEAGADVLLQAAADDPDGSVTAVQFYTGTHLLAEVASPPFARLWRDVEAGAYWVQAAARDDLHAWSWSDAVSITVVTNTPPAIVAIQPSDFVVGELSSIRVLFSEPVTGVQASDLLINGVPATSLSGTGADYTFAFVQPPFGSVTIGWAADHGIADLGPRPGPFDAQAAGATWGYLLLDLTPPRILARAPEADTVVTSLTSVQVVFTEAVTNVDAADLFINGQPATAVIRNESNYLFSFPQPPFGPVQITWAPNHDIMDYSSNRFDTLDASASWTCTLSNAAAPFVAQRVPSPGGPSYRQVEYVFVISVDGLRADLLRDYIAAAPGRFAAFRRLAVEGAFTYNARPDYDITVTTPNHCCMMTGLPVLHQPGWAPELHHGVTDNSTTTLIIHQWNPAVTYIPSVFDVVHDYGLTTASYVSKQKLSIFERSYNATWGAPDLVGDDDGRDKVDTAVTVDGSSVSLINALLTAEPRHFTFMHITEPDGAGHGSGWGSAAWSNSVATVSGYLSAVLDLVETNLIYRGRTAIILTADHGGVGNDHSAASNPAVYTIPFMVWGADLPAGADLYQFMANRFEPGTARPSYSDARQPIRNGDSGNLGLTLLGLPPIPNSVMKPEFAPAGGRTNALTAVLIAFTKPVTNVDAGDLLVNGVPATGVTGDGLTFTFSFPQPPYGTVVFSWAPTHGIVDLETPPNSFDASAPAETWQIELYLQAPPTLASVVPAPSAVVTNLTSVAVTFSEAVRGVSAEDLLINGAPATAVSGSGSNYTFTFLQPAAGTVQFTWAAAHAIQDLEMPALAFDGTATGATWSYEFLDATRPEIVSRSPAPGANVGSLSEAQVVFSEPVDGVTADDLLINGTPALAVIGANASFTFTFTPPAPGSVTFTWANNHGITDRATPANAFDATAPGAAWTCSFAIGPITLVATGSVWKYLDNGSDQGVAWRAPGFDDTTWAYGPAELGYGDDVEGRPEATVVSYGPNPNNKYITTYFRRAFDVANPALYESLILDLLRDDGGVVYLNGVEVYRNNMPSSVITYTTLAANGTSGETTYYRASVAPTVLVAGQNVLAVEIHQSSVTSSDLSFDLGLSATLLKVPAAPLNLVAQPLTTNQIRLQWTDPATNEAGFAVERSLEGSNFVRHLTLAANTTETVDAGLEAGATYYYRVVAFNAAGESPFSNLASATTPSAPQAPTQLLAAALGTNRIQLAWTDTATNETGFHLERSLDGTNFALIATLGADVTNVMDDLLLGGTTYFYRVRAFNAVGASGFSNPAGATTAPIAPPPAAPTQLAAVAGNGRQYFRGQIFLNWRDRSTNESGFLIERSRDAETYQPVATVPANQPHYTDRGLESATVYYYRVRAINAGGGSEASNLAAEETHPQTQMALAGDSVEFHAGAEGLAPIRYQWRFEGFAIPGETNETLRLHHVMPWDEGGYSVAVTDLHGRIESNPAWLFVLSEPVIVTQPADSTNNLGSTAAFRVAAAGTEPLFFQWRRDGTNLAGAVNPALLLTNLAPEDFVSYDVIVENDFGAVTSRVVQLVLNVPPTAGADTVLCPWGESLRINISALLTNDYDPDGASVSFHSAGTNTARGGQIETRLGYLLYTPPDLSGQPDQFEYVIQDAWSGMATGSVTITFPPNTAPVFALLPEPDLVVDEGARISFTVAAVDAETPPQTLSLTLAAGVPAGASFDPATGAFLWQTTEADGPGIYLLTFEAWDNGNPALTNSATIRITVNEMNEPPRLASIGDRTVIEGETLSFTASATDTDLPAQPLTFSLDPGAPAGARIDPASGVFTWATTEAEGPGAYSITVRVTDGAVGGASMGETIVVTVFETNQPPVLTVESFHEVNEGEMLAFSVIVADNDWPTQTLMLEVTGLPEGASYGSGGRFVWTPTEAQGPSTNRLLLRLSDTAEPPLSVTSVVTIVVREVNQAPTLAGLRDYTIGEWESLDFVVEASDADLPAQMLSFRLADGAPLGAAIAPTTGVFTWRPSEIQGPTTNRIGVIALDTGLPSLGATQWFNVVVRDTRADFVLSAGSTNLLVGESNSIPIRLLSELDLWVVLFDLELDTTRLTNLALRVVSPEVKQAYFRPLAADRFLVSLGLAPARRTAADRVLVDLEFASVAEGDSAIIPVRLLDPLVLLEDGFALTDGQANAGQIFLVNQSPLVWAARRSGLRLTLFGQPGASYTIETANDVVMGPWQPMHNVPLNLPSVSLPVDTQQPMAFYRARAFTADPPHVELWRPEQGPPVWVLYGLPGATYLLEPAVTGAQVASGAMRLTLTNSFAVLGEATNATAPPPFRVRQE